MARNQPCHQMLRVSSLSPLPANPNRMTQAAFDQYKSEVERLRRPPKPIVVRQLGNHYQIVDGEHGWRAARSLGITKVLCEVIEAVTSRRCVSATSETVTAKMTRFCLGDVSANACDKVICRSGNWPACWASPTAR